MVWKPALAVVAALSTASCGIYRQMYAPPAQMGSDWRQVATETDRDRLRRWHVAWDEALPAARAADPAGVAAAGALLEPDRALPGAMPPPGSYRCRTYKLGDAVEVEVQKVDVLRHQIDLVVPDAAEEGDDADAS